MDEILTFKGTKAQVIDQLSKYMSKLDAEKFFAKYFNQDTTAPQGVELSTKRMDTQDFEKVLSKYIFRNRNIIIPSLVNQNDLVFYYFLVYSIEKERSAHLLLALNKDLPDDSIVQSQSEDVDISTKATQDRNQNSSFNEWKNAHIASNYNNDEICDYCKTFAKVVFIFAALALDIVLKITLGIAPIGNVIGLLPRVKLSSFQEPEKIVAKCFVSVVSRQHCVIPYKSLRRSNCKNNCLNCIFQNGKRCGITEEMYVKVLNKLLDKKIIVLDENKTK